MNIWNPEFWVDEKGNHPKHLQIITKEDVDIGKYKPLHSFDVDEYYKSLEKLKVREKHYKELKNG